MEARRKEGGLGTKLQESFSKTTPFTLDIKVTNILVFLKSAAEKHENVASL